VNTIELTPGPQDLDSPIGPVGVGGQNGATVEQSATDPAGADGTNGVDGAKGATGLKGREDPIGPIVAVGPRGEQGHIRETDADERWAQRALKVK
jgi:hypothetical protein